MEVSEVLEKITQNLQKNGFPDKKVRFPKSSIEKFVLSHDFDLETILYELQEDDIYHQIEGDKIVFSMDSFEQTKDSPNLSDLNLESLKNMDPKLLKEQAEKFMEQMTPQQKQELAQKFMTMSDKEKEELSKLSKDLNIDPKPS